MSYENFIDHSADMPELGADLKRLRHELEQAQSEVDRLTDANHALSWQLNRAYQAWQKVYRAHSKDCVSPCPYCEVERAFKEDGE